MKLELKVNGRPYALEVPEDIPLLWALRDHAGLKGTKFGCGAAQCGACTVHVDGQPKRSCVTPAASCAGKEITTVEGLSPAGTHALQRAWEELDVPQCGYCQAGQLMSAAALLQRTQAPSDEQIDNALNGNLCRCTTYLRVRKAVHRAAELLRDEGKPKAHTQAAAPAGSTGGAQ
jgi:isoquinoline 1-oxidoreductase subunit alpha